MKALFKLLLFITTLTLTSCYEKQTNSFSSSNTSITSEREYTYVDVMDKTIFWDDVFSISKEEYYVYFFSRTCSHCNELKPFVIEAGLYRDDIYFVEASSDIKYAKDNQSIIGVDNIDDLGILGYPTLLKIVEGVVAKNLVGSAQIKNELTN